MASIPVSQYPPAAMIALLSRSTNQSRSPKKRKLPSSSPAPQSIPEPFDHGQQAPEFQRVRILLGSEKESRSQDAHPAATTKSHQITARSSGTLEWPCPPIFQVVVRTPKPRETERFLLGARWLLGSGGAGNNFYGAQAQRPRPILLASLIESAPNCAAANWDSVLPLYEVSFSSPFSKSCEVKPVDGLSNFLFLAVIDVYSREMMRT